MENNVKYILEAETGDGEFCWYCPIGVFDTLELLEQARTEWENTITELGGKYTREQKMEYSRIEHINWMMQYRPREKDGLYNPEINKERLLITDEHLEYQAWKKLLESLGDVGKDTRISKVESNKITLEILKSK